MAENSAISWTDHTFNPWMGCTKVSPGCKFCYAETLMDDRYGKVKWGPQGERILTSQANWRKPVQWNKASWFQCRDCGWRGSRIDIHQCPTCKGFNMDSARQRVFCASLADVFESKKDQWLDMHSWRMELFDLIEQTTNLDWLILTKRPENVMKMIPEHWKDVLPYHVWIGTSVENQEYADQRIPELLRIPARIRFLSAEPLLGPIDLKLDAFFDPEYYDGKIGKPRDGIARRIQDLIHWVIVGGESGPGARPMHPQWARDLRDQCQLAGVPFHFKQWGEFHPSDELVAYRPHVTVNTIQDLPMYRVGKHQAGRLLDGRTWEEFPR